MIHYLAHFACSFCGQRLLLRVCVCVSVSVCVCVYALFVCARACVCAHMCLVS